MAESTNGAAEPVAPSGAASPDPGIKEFLDFDPFEPPSGGQDAKAVPADEPETEAPGDALPPDGQQQPAVDRPPSAGDDPVLRELARINETLVASRQQPQYQQPQPASPAEPKPRYNLEIPQQVLKAVIHSEDPEERAAGLAALVNGLANTIYNDMSREFQAQQMQVVNAIPQMHQRLSQEQVEQQRAAQDFFGRFTSLKPTPQMMKFVGDEARALAAELWHAGNRNLSWNEEFREALGQRIHAGLGLQFPRRSPLQQMPPGAPPRAPKRPQFASGGDAKGNSERRAPNAEAQEIWDVFGYNN